MNNPRHQAAHAALLSVLIVISLAFIRPVSSLAQQTPGKPVVLNVTVTDKRGRFAMGLEKSHFAVFDNKAPQEITYFKGQDEPVSVGFILDASGSMNDYRKSDLIKSLYKEAVARFIKQSNQSNMYFLIGFNKRPQLLLDWRRGNDAINDLQVKIESLQPDGNTALYDACYLGIEKLMVGAHQKRVIILIGDGQDNESRYSFANLRERLRESGVLFYAVGVTNSTESYSSIGMQGQGILDELATTSGGRGFFPEKPSHMRDIFDIIAAELRHQYSIGFVSSITTSKSEWRRLKIKLTIPPDAPQDLQHLLARSREGYYANVYQR
jgi:Ca-activated chloride channel family protein